MTEASESKPVIRIRVAHTQTIKEGWRLSETTVEYSGDSIDWAVFNSEMMAAFKNGSAEARQRNILEGRTG